MGLLKLLNAEDMIAATDIADQYTIKDLFFDEERIGIDEYLSNNGIKAFGSIVQQKGLEKASTLVYSEKDVPKLIPTLKKDFIRAIKKRIKRNEETCLALRAQ